MGKLTYEQKKILIDRSRAMQEAFGEPFEEAFSNICHRLLGAYDSGQAADEAKAVDAAIGDELITDDATWAILRQYNDVLDVSWNKAVKALAADALEVLGDYKKAVAGR